MTGGVARSAANIDKSWIDTDAAALFGKALGGREVTVLNDADAAGIAEDSFGAGKDTSGVVILLTFGTGIGSAVLHNGVLLPNTEFGHLEVDGKEAEHRAASSVKEKKDWSYKEWASRGLPSSDHPSRTCCGLISSSPEVESAASTRSGFRT